MKTEIELNYNSLKERTKIAEKTSKKILIAIIKASDRETVIEVLKKLKIIKTDLNLKTNKLELMERKA